MAPLLIFAYGNPSRGDDALGPKIFELLEKNKQQSSELASFDSARSDWTRVDLLTDYQLQIEHAIDLEQRECVLFIDASVSSTAPYAFYPLQAERDDSYTTHAMSPVAVLDVYQQINQSKPPPTYMLTIRGYQFGLGQDLSEQAKINLQQGYEFVNKLLATDLKLWPEKIIN
ncbi:MAG: hydrogenase maturation protease [Proteobacteria bacterium]|nr:hydrogenase maturation protease [Pseudomonadota bacterium]